MSECGPSVQRGGDAPCCASEPSLPGQRETTPLLLCRTKSPDEFEASSGKLRTQACRIFTLLSDQREACLVSHWIYAVGGTQSRNMAGGNSSDSSWSWSHTANQHTCASEVLLLVTNPVHAADS
eukprot:3171915-Amphidinium_carterae.1